MKERAEENAYKMLMSSSRRDNYCAKDCQCKSITENIQHLSDGLDKHDTRKRNFLKITRTTSTPLELSQVLPSDLLKLKEKNASHMCVAATQARVQLMKCDKPKMRLFYGQSALSFFLRLALNATSNIIHFPIAQLAGTFL